MFCLFLGGSLCFFLVSLILQDFFDRLFLGRLFTFLCAGCGFPYPVADVPQLLQILLYLGQRYFQLCDFAENRFLLLLQLIFRFILIVRVLGKIGGGFRISGNLQVFLLEFLLCFLKKYLLVLFIDRFTFLAGCPAGKNPVNHFAAGFLWLHLIAVICG